MKERIIVALDTDSPDSALSVVKALAGEVGLFKVGMELFPRGGPDLVRRIRGAGADVFLDLKFHDIPNTVAGAVRSAAALGVTFATVHALGGREMLARAAEAARETGTTVLAVTVLTSLDDSDLLEAGFSSSSAETVLRLEDGSAGRNRGNRLLRPGSRCRPGACGEVGRSRHAGSPAAGGRGPGPETGGDAV